MVKMTAHEEYQLTGKGLFIIVKQTRHNFWYNEVDWSDRRILNYDADEERLLETFNLKEGISYNLRLGTNLTNSKESGTNLTNSKSFDDFMKEVLNYPHEPSFVMFMLMSHGFSKGVFLLATDPLAEPKQSTRSPSTLETCCSGTHDHMGECFSRRVVQDIITPICKRFKDIPKIFILQMCRGSETSVVLKGAGDAPPSTANLNADTGLDSEDQTNSDSEPSVHDYFIPERYSDMFVYRPCIEGQFTWVSAIAKEDSSTESEEEDDDDDDSIDPDGSLIFTYFCETIKELAGSKRVVEVNETPEIVKSDCEEPISDYQAFIDDLYPRAIHTDGVKPDSDCQYNALNRRLQLTKCKLSIENLTGGWLTNVCTRTTAKVTNVLIRQKESYKKEGKKRRRKPNYIPIDKQQPHITSTLRYPLSINKLMKTQWETGKTKAAEKAE